MAKVLMEVIETCFACPYGIYTENGEYPECGTHCEHGNFPDNEDCFIGNDCSPGGGFADDYVSEYCPLPNQLEETIFPSLKKE